MRQDTHTKYNGAERRARITQVRGTSESKHRTYRGTIPEAVYGSRFIEQRAANAAKQAAYYARGGR